MMNELEIGNRYKKIREYLKLSQTKLAEETESFQGYISRIEKGKMLPTFANMYVLANRFKVNLNYLFGTSDNILNVYNVDSVSELANNSQTRK